MSSVPPADRSDVSQPAAAADITSPAHDAARARPSAVTQTTRVETLRVRRAPNLVAFLITGGVIGAVVGLIIGVVGPGSVYYTRGAVVGFFLMLFLILGATLGAVLALLLDRISLKRARETDVEVRDVQETVTSE